MSDIAKGVGDLFASIVEIVKEIFITIIHVFEGAFNAVVGIFKGVFNMTEGVLGFIIGNFFLLGTVAAVYFGYILYQQRQGRNPAPLSAAATKKTR
ncbi:uncharacterized protein A1O9_12444 [Exophiala aquamarina CBS 119918]|uniref:Uncharacterized protein n=1 Tax=Exophiala aquamarina CBS 119918 TaxID=1182545 RepID=A0A072NVU8_9EURO|nr:uncharacterized protein A1O9_12444 [Exophiala aquamarina CBS 119918]KEF51527.1 hypothetical protein A1O9_12444 [Exophiala aquamarina CBS 119918]